jgi:hypothetical protein
MERGRLSTRLREPRTFRSVRSMRSLLLRVHCTRTRNPWRGNADSPSDGLRPSSAQCSIRRGDCAWTTEGHYFPYITRADRLAATPCRYRPASNSPVTRATRPRLLAATPLTARPLFSVKARRSFFSAAMNGSAGGIAIALLAMGVDAHVLPAGIAIPAQKPNSEDDHA